MIKRNRFILGALLLLAGIAFTNCATNATADTCKRFREAAREFTVAAEGAVTAAQKRQAIQELSHAYGEARETAADSSQEIRTLMERLAAAAVEYADAWSESFDSLENLDDILLNAKVTAAVVRMSEACTAHGH